jgi:UDP-galactopyranose mutase
MYDVVCLSHLRWGFVYQRPQHLLRRWARDHRVFYFEEPVEAPELGLETRVSPEGVTIVVPQLPSGLDVADADAIQQTLLDELFVRQEIERYVLWVYTPMAAHFAEHLTPLATVYDCMDELTGFAGAPLELAERERRLLRRADLVFTGGQSLYEAKRELHPSVHAFPSSVEAAHFRQARAGVADPPDQADIPHPRLGWYGVIDERVDLGLVAGLADSRPDWQLVLVGPVTKIDEASLPRRENIHYLGMKDYAELPAYAGSSA